MSLRAFLIVAGQLACGNTNEAAQWLRLDWRATQRIMDRAVQRGLARRQLEEVPYLGMDEKSFRKGHRYGSLVNDLKQGRVLEVVEHRTSEAASAALQALPAQTRASVKAVAKSGSTAPITPSSMPTESPSKSSNSPRKSPLLYKRDSRTRPSRKLNGSALSNCARRSKAFSMSFVLLVMVT